MNINYREIAERAAAYAKELDIELDYSKGSIEDVDFILGCYHERLAEYDGEDGANTLWNIAVHFGIYLGETLLRLQLEEKGFAWYVDGGAPVLRKDDSHTEVSPITKAHKRILNGPEDSVKSFCDVAFLIAEGRFPTRDVLRVVDVELSSGQTLENVLYRDMDSYIMLVEEGKEDFLILSSHDGFLQFYGVHDQFVGEVRVNLPDGDFHTYSIIDKDKEHLTERVQLTTPFGQYTPTAREVVSLELIRDVVEKYYKNLKTDDFLRDIPCVETTEETKRYMGIGK